MLVDAIVLAGGRSSRLGTAHKAELRFEGESLLAHSLAAVDGARQVVVVGPVAAGALEPGVLQAREEPVFGGPAAGLAAGLAALTEASPSPSDALLVLACDMPYIARAVPFLLGALAGAAADGAIAVDREGKHQPLAGLYRTASIRSAIARIESSGSLHSLSMHRLIRDLDLIAVGVPEGSTADVDTWDDVARLGVTPKPSQL